MILIEQWYSLPTHQFEAVPCLYYHHLDYISYLELSISVWTWRVFMTLQGGKHAEFMKLSPKISMRCRLLIFSFIGSLDFYFLYLLYIVICLRIKFHKIPGEWSSTNEEQRVKRGQNVLKLGLSIVLGFIPRWPGCRPVLPGYFLISNRLFHFPVGFLTFMLSRVSYRKAEFCSVQ